jgi:hypothetical protein
MHPEDEYQAAPRKFTRYELPKIEVEEPMPVPEPHKIKFDLKLLVSAQKALYVYTYEMSINAPSFSLK